MLLGNRLVDSEKITFDLGGLGNLTQKIGELKLASPYNPDSNGFVSLNIDLSGQIGDRSPAKFAIVSDYLTYQDVLNAKTFQEAEYDKFESKECEKTKQEFNKNKPTTLHELNPECPKPFKFEEDWLQIVRTKNVLRINPETKAYSIKIHQSLVKELEGKLIVWFDEKGMELKKAAISY